MMSLDIREHSDVHEGDSEIVKKLGHNVNYIALDEPKKIKFLLKASNFRMN
ncbi:MAG: hypothetical protein CM1200mP10_28870 [Candidatus Neomarinimicrobiota bacterium]|nr:MAG: hypothetical protein CM1200mP10_28870 [Candidatus Neomarinimicrobiota bacterium]